MRIDKREALVAKGVIIVAWLLFALSIGVGLQAGANAHQGPAAESITTETTHRR